MKKFSILFALLFGAVNLIYGQNVNIPDALFKSYLINNSSINTNGDNEIQISEAVAFTGTINCSYRLITSMTGIEAFVNLKSLICFSTRITNLDISKNTALVTLDCSSTLLTNLVTNNPALTELNCSDNKLTSLDVTKNTALKILNCNYNQLTTLDVSKNTTLTELIFFNNKITSLDVSKNIVLAYLDCRQNNLTSLDVSKNTALTYLNCNSNQLTSLDVSKNIALAYLNCNSNQLTRLNIKNGKNTLIVSSNYQDFRNNNNNSNYNLTCIQVDNVAYSTTNWTNKDLQASYNTNCNYMSVNDLQKPAIKAYPNPVRNILKIQSEDKLQKIEIYSENGQLVKTSFLKETNLTGLPKGNYLVKITTDKGIQTEKLIKE